MVDIGYSQGTYMFLKTCTHSTEKDIFNACGTHFNHPHCYLSNTLKSNIKIVVLGIWALVTVN